MIESEESTHTALPVRQRNLFVVPFRQIVVTEVVAADDPGAFIVAQSKVAIRGKQLRGEVTEVHTGGVTATLQNVSDTEITATLPAGLPAGVQGLQVVQPRLMGTPPHAGAGPVNHPSAYPLFIAHRSDGSQVGGTSGGGGAARVGAKNRTGPTSRTLPTSRLKPAQ